MPAVCSVGYITLRRSAEQDEFAAALKLRNDAAVWQTAHGGVSVSVDEHVWPVAAR